LDDDEIRIDCNKEGVGRKFGRIDFSKGFSQWWFLSHIDFHTPSEHTQEGKRYDGGGRAPVGSEARIGTYTIFQFRSIDGSHMRRETLQNRNSWQHEDEIAGMEEAPIIKA
jgi:hypothetical protein